MRRVLLIIVSLIVVPALTLHGAEGNPILRWLVNPAAATTSDAALRAILPNVQGVRVDGGLVVVESAGLSLQSRGPIAANDREPGTGVRKFIFRFPLKAKPEARIRTRTPLGVVGAFLDGVPCYTPVSAVSYRGQDLWQSQPVATAHPAAQPSPVFDSMLNPADRH